ncbi:GNAT family N-acetyltransferase [Rufibacter psychrotolerans]|uniref:GNAT family N-acetyltransferase n=1 Tax=Rufibacter psychrotolerans TaxID=2812556 RepID=UPI001966E8C2|nr:GNAT family N-acetyltransferase [Rufibacter sp. SYSU D00308]
MTTTPSFSGAVAIQVTTDAALIRQLAHATWYPTYGEILDKDQIDFMLEEIYSLESLTRQMQEGQTFLLLLDQEKPAAFAAFSLVDPARQLFKLNKLYIHPQFQGKGYGKLLLEEVKNRAKQLGGAKLELNVHRHNPAQHFYHRHGFKIAQVVDIPFGRFTLNDYIMQLDL